MVSLATHEASALLRRSFPFANNSPENAALYKRQYFTIAKHSVVLIFSTIRKSDTSLHLAIPLTSSHCHRILCNLYCLSLVHYFHIVTRRVNLGCPKIASFLKITNPRVVSAGIGPKTSSQPKKFQKKYF